MTNILNMTDAELAGAAAEAFAPEGERKHDLNKQDGRDRTCMKCGRTTYRCGCFQNGLESNKTHPDPLDVTDLGLAMRTFRDLPNGKAMEQVEKFYMWTTNCSLPCTDPRARHEWKMTIFWWFIRHATLQQIWRIILLAKENKL